MECKLEAAGFLSCVEMPPCLSSLPSHLRDPLRMFDNVYVDDAAVMLVSRCPFSIVRKAAEAARIIRKVYSSYSLLINMKPGKSKVMFSLYGVGTKQIWHDLINVRKCLLPIDGTWSVTEFVDSADCISVVNAYKHMGGTSTPSVTMKHEIKIRAASMYGVFRSTRNIFYLIRASV